jgi:hypothetical protein
MTALFVKAEVDETSTHTKASDHFTSTPDHNGVIQSFDNINMERLTTEALVDTEYLFEAALFDHQSQESIGHLYWNQNDGVGKIIFEYGGITEQVDLEISDILSMDSSERYRVLLNGLYETGLTWINQYQAGSAKSVHKGEPQDDYVISASRRGQRPRGHFDWIKPSFNNRPSVKPVNLKRVAQGWAYDPDRPNRSIWVQIYARSLTQRNAKYRMIKTVYANRMRKDVNRAHRIRGRHGWRLTLPERWDADSYRDRSDICSTGTEYNGHKLIQCSAQFRPHAMDLSGDGKTELNTQTARLFRVVNNPVR